MKLVIDIPEKEYQDVMRGRWEGNPLADYIETGVRLPKGHGRLVDVDKVRTELDWLEKVTNEGSVVEQAAHRKLMQCINVVNAAQVIIEADMTGEEE